MKAFLKLTWVEVKLFSRNGVALFFTLAFPILNILLFGAMYAEYPVQGYAGHSYIDQMIPGYIGALVIGTSAFMNLSLEMASRRQTGVLRRLNASSLHPLTMLAAQVVINLMVSLFGSILLIGTGMLFYKGSMPVNILSFLGAFLLSSLGLYTLSFALVGLIRSVTTARAVFMSIFFPMMFLSGGTLPLQLMPEVMQQIAEFIPLTYVVRLLNRQYLANEWDMTAVVVLVALLAVSLLLASWVYRRNPLAA